MKKRILVILAVIFPLFTFSQNSLSTTGNVGIGTVNPTAKLEVSNGAFKVGNVENRNFTVAFPNDVSNQTIDVMFGNTYVNGFIEIEITSDFYYQNSVGVVKKIFSVGANPNGAVWNSTTSRIVESEGQVSKNFTIGDFSWDATKSSYKISVHHIVKTGNTLFVNIKYSSSFLVPLLETTVITAPYTATIPTSYSYPQSVYFNGNVGIGTSNPLAKLDINGVIQTYNKDNNGASWDNVRMWAEGENGYIEANGDENGLIIRSNTGNKILLMSNVGIGTTTPDSKLTVNGNIHAKEVKIDLSVPAPDYVFALDYKLRTLEEVESFIKENSHLPEIPSAREIEKNGLMLAEMNMLLLKKMEEMTLYMIDFKKEIDVLKDENRVQQEEISRLKKTKK